MCVSGWDVGDVPEVGDPVRHPDGLRAARGTEDDRPPLPVRRHPKDGPSPAQDVVPIDGLFTVLGIGEFGSGSERGTVERTTKALARGATEAAAATKALR